MPRGNKFQHQSYGSGPPTSPYHLLQPERDPPAGSDEYLARMDRTGQALRSAGVAAIYLVHGTFAGTDAWGIIAEIARFLPDLEQHLRRLAKQTVDAVAQEAGNYTRHYARHLQEGLGGSGSATIPVRLFHWSSENHHVGRAEAAIQLIDTLAEQESETDGRILLWGHSHGGNVMALMTNLLRADAHSRHQFFDAATVQFRGSGSERTRAWQRVRELLAHDEGDKRRQKTPRPSMLDLVTFGTPIRYGWDVDRSDHLLHFIYHRPVEGVPAYAVPFPPSVKDIINASFGDFVHQFGIAGTDLGPGLLTWRTWLANRRLGRLVQSRLRRRDLVRHLKAGVRVAEDGTSLLVDYGPADGHIGQHMAGHAVYTRPEWMLFHVEQVARRLYGLTAD